MEDLLQLMFREEEIMQSWESKAPSVSILLTTYNHEAFLYQALVGALMQRTKFPFNILIRDDASTDATPKILRNFQNMFPSIIQLFLEKENTFQHTSTFDVLVPEVTGDFVATLEGDDY